MPPAQITQIRVVFAFIAAVMDARSLRKADDRAPGFLSGVRLVLGGWAYLLVRAIRRKTGADWGVFAAACIAATILTIVSPVANAVRTSNSYSEIPKLQAAIAT